MGSLLRQIGAASSSRFGSLPLSAMLLRLEGIDIDRKLGGANDIGKEYELPAFHLGAIRKIQIFGQRVVLPATGGRNCVASPNTAVPLKLKKAPERFRAVCSSRKWPSRKSD